MRHRLSFPLWCLAVLLLTVQAGGDEPVANARGYTLIFEVDADTAAVTNELLQVITSRLDAAKLLNNRVRALSDRQIEVHLPELPTDRLADVQQIITAQGVMELRILASPYRHQAIIELAADAPHAVRRDDKIVARWITYNPQQINLLEDDVAARDTEQPTRREVLLIETPPHLSDRDIANVARDLGSPDSALQITFTEDGAQRLRILTETHQPFDDGRVFFLGVVLDDRLLIAPSIRGVIGAQAVLNGLEPDDMQLLLTVLKAGRLPTTLRPKAVSITRVQAAAKPQWIIDTVAGTGDAALGPAAGPAQETNIGDPFGVEIGPDGALYITEVRNHRVWRLDLATHQLKTVAGNGTKGYAGDDGPATAAALNEPYEVRFDAAGHMFFVEMQNHLVRRVDAQSGVITTVAGTGERGFAGDGGPANKAQFDRPHSIVVGHHSVIIADIGNHRVRRVDLESGLVETIAGTGERTLPRDGQLARGRALLGPRALWMDDQQLWIALREGHSVWMLLLKDEQLRHVAGTGQRGFTGDGGPSREATFDGPKGIALDSSGNIYIADTENHAIRRIDRISGIIETIAGGGPDRGGFGGDGGPGPEALLNRPHGICVGPDGAVYVGDTLNHRVRRIRPVVEAAP